MRNRAGTIGHVGKSEGHVLRRIGGREMKKFSRQRLLLLTLSWLAMNASIGTADTREIEGYVPESVVLEATLLRSEIVHYRYRAFT